MSFITPSGALFECAFFFLLSLLLENKSYNATFNKYNITFCFEIYQEQSIMYFSEIPYHRSGSVHLSLKCRKTIALRVNINHPAKSRQVTRLI
jgi:hypothetical protein